MTRRNLIFALAGFIAGIASVKSYPVTTGMMLGDGEIWQRTYEVTNDPDVIDKQGRSLMVSLQQKTNRYPREVLVLACSLKRQPRADQGAAGGGKGVTLVVADPHSVQAEGREAAYLLWKKAADRPAEFSERSEAIGEFRDAIEHPDFRNFIARVQREKNP